MKSTLSLDILLLNLYGFCTDEELRDSINVIPKEKTLTVGLYHIVKKLMIVNYGLRKITETD